MSACENCALLRKAVLVIPASTVQIVAYKILVDIVDDLDAASIGSRLDAFPCALTRIVHLVEADAVQYYIKADLRRWFRRSLVHQR